MPETIAGAMAGPQSVCCPFVLLCPGPQGVISGENSMNLVQSPGKNQLKTAFFSDDHLAENSILGDQIIGVRGGGGRALEVGGLWRWEDFGGGGGLGGEVEGLGKEK